MGKKAIGGGGPARVVVDDELADGEDRERSEIRLRSGIHPCAARRRRRASSRPPIGRARPERRPRPLLELVQRVGPAKRHSSGERIGRRLPWMSLAYAGVAAYGIASGLHPMAPPIVVALASASSAALVAMMARHRMVSAPYAVAFAAITASTHAWAQACVAPDGANASTFALTALCGSILFEKPSHLAGYLSVLAGGFIVALGASAVPEPITAWLELTLASLVAVAVTVARSARRPV